jgi:hypothetical protein
MAVDTVQYLGVDLGYRFFAETLGTSDEARAIHDTMVEAGLTPQPERSQLFNVFSRDSLKSVAISITPFSSDDLSREGGLSVSQGGHAQGVIVDLEDRVHISRFTHIAVTKGKVVSSEHDVTELRKETRREAAEDDRIKAFAERAGKIKVAGPLVEIDARQVRSLGGISFNSLLGDRFSSSVHDEQQIAALRAETNVVAQIGLFVLFRTQGSACCSCSCSCWGSSSCSTSSVG